MEKELVEYKEFDFMGDNLIAVEYQGQWYVSPRRICDNIGISWSSQLQKLQAHPDKFGCARVKMPGKDGKKHSMLGIPEKNIEQFVKTVNPNRVGNKKNVVYFIQIKNGPIKIGLTGNVKNRLKSLSCSLPYDLELLHVMPGDEKLEKKLHKKFCKYHIRGEWFECHDGILNYLKKLQSKNSQVAKNIEL